MIETIIHCDTPGCKNTYIGNSSLAFKSECDAIKAGWKMVMSRENKHYCPECAKTKCNDFHNLKTIDELAEEQGIEPIDDLSKLICPEIALDDETIEQARNPSPWLPIETFVPPEFKKNDIAYSFARCLVYEPNSITGFDTKIADYKYSEDGVGNWVEYGIGYFIIPTHWMPLPPIPGGAK